MHFELRSPKSYERVQWFDFMGQNVAQWWNKAAQQESRQIPNASRLIQGYVKYFMQINENLGIASFVKIFWSLNEGI